MMEGFKQPLIVTKWHAWAAVLFCFFTLAVLRGQSCGVETCVDSVEGIRDRLATTRFRCPEPARGKLIMFGDVHYWECTCAATKKE